jgi:2-polyprenyl-3-methyl-5-hydroxy-6-metoxy-1,4-benzoquinol methylase
VRDDRLVACFLHQQWTIHGRVKLSRVPASSRLELALALYSGLPLCERLHVSARAEAAPLRSLVARTPAGKVLDAGCGDGVLSALLAQDSPRRQVLGVDPDGRSIRRAQLSVGALPNVAFREATVEQLLPEHEGSFDAVVMADVLFLLPEAQVRALLAAAFLLLKPEGRLLLTESEAEGSWRSLLWHLRAWVGVALLRRTGELVPREVQVARLHAAGFRVEEVRSLAQGYSAPYALFNARRAA